jgi:hypothetical protein
MNRGEIRCDYQVEAEDMHRLLDKQTLVRIVNF